jgi:hypothetical protein
LSHSVFFLLTFCPLFFFIPKLKVDNINLSWKNPTKNVSSSI